MRGDGRVFLPKRYGVELPFWNVAYWARRKDGTLGEIRESSRSTDRRDAERLLKRRIREAENDRFGIRRFVPPSHERVTITELLDALDRYYETNRPKSLRTARTAIRHIRARFGSMRAAAVTSDLVREYIAERLAAGARPSTVNRATEKLQRAFSLAIQDGRLAFAPRIDSLPENNAREGTISAADFESRMAAIEDPDFVDYCRWLYLSGARPGSAAALTWDAFTKQDWSIKLHPRDDKTGSWIQWSLTGPFREIIERRLARRRLDCNLIFFRGKGRPFVSRQPNGTMVYHYTAAWKKAGQDAKVPDFEIYALRRTAITNNRRAGIPPKVAMALSGHRTTATFHRYNIVDGNDLQEATEKRATYERNLLSGKAKGQQ